MTTQPTGDDVTMIDLVFDGPPGPVGGRFVECEDPTTGRSVGVGEWIHRDDGYWVLRLPVASLDLRRAAS